jgi:hypothetical protein
MAQAREDQQKQPAQAIENDTALMNPFEESNEQITTKGNIPPVLGDFGNAGPSASDRAYGGYVRVLASTLNVRSSPSKESKGNIIGKLHRGQLVEQRGREGDWVKINFHGQNAYVHHSYVVAADTRPSPEAMADVMNDFREVNGDQGRGKPPGDAAMADVMNDFREVNGDQGRGKPPSKEAMADVMQDFWEVNGPPASTATTPATTSTTATPATTSSTASTTAPETDPAKLKRIQELANDAE